MNTITIHDETATGSILSKINLAIEKNIITVEELIRQRVTQEVERYNRKQPEYFNGLVQPTESERTLNGYKLKKRQLINVETQVAKALNAFQSNGFFIIVDDKQVESLEEKILVNQLITISFVKLAPLVGG